MRYLGGKTRNAKAIIEVLNSYRDPGQLYFEPFCGGLSVAMKMNGPMYLNDVHCGLISLYKAIQDNIFVYPEQPILIEEYENYREKMDYNDPMTAFVGFGLSYAGKWFGGYDTYYDNREQVGKTTRMCINSLKKKFNTEVKRAEFSCKDYRMFDPVNLLIYCDPPYAGTTTYDGVDDFDTEEFWDIMREWSVRNTVLISEFDAPSDFEMVWSADYKVQMCKEQQRVVERLFKMKG